MRKTFVILTCLLLISAQGFTAEKLNDEGLRTAVQEASVQIHQIATQEGREGYPSYDEVRKHFEAIDAAIAKAEEPSSDMTNSARIFKLRMLASLGYGNEAAAYIKSIFPHFKEASIKQELVLFTAQLFMQQRIQDGVAELAALGTEAGLPEEQQALIDGLARNAALQPNSVFPNFSGPGLKGEKIELAQYKGKVVLIDFWATWCGPCIAELPTVQETYKQYADQGFEIIGVSLDHELSTLNSFLGDNELPWVHIAEGLGYDSVIARQFGISAIPATYLLGPDGTILARDLRGEELPKAVADAIDKLNK